MLLGPHVLAFLPALMLGGYWYGGEGLLLYMALLLPALFAIAGLFSGTGTSWPDDYDGTTGLNLRRVAVKRLDAALQSEAETGKSSAAIAVVLDDFRALERQFGTPAADAVRSTRHASMQRRRSVSAPWPGPPRKPARECWIAPRLH